MVTAFLTGGAISFSLILAIGAQNAFVLRQGLLRQHVFAVALFCALSDALLISIGVSGGTWLLGDFIASYSFWVLSFAAVWLIAYGLMRLFAALNKKGLITDQKIEPKSLLPTLTTAALFTFGNPHVYLDTIGLIGTLSTTFPPVDRVPFTIGAAAASFVFFFALAYGAKLLAPKIQNPNMWRILDLSIALIMFLMAFGMLGAAGWV
jgi:L-lysine exporter family protein LysE/ArgO